MKLMKIIGILIAIPVVGIIGLLIIGAIMDATNYEPSERSKNKDKVLSQLKDPDSAKFGSTFGKDGKCGTVNAKNGFGAYTGYKRFVVDKQYGAVIESNNSDNQLLNELWRKSCI